MAEGRRFARRGGRDEDDADAEERLEHSALLRLEGLLARRSRGFAILVGLLLLALVGLIDALTGAFAVSVFYFVPVGLVTFSRGRWMGAMMSLVASAAWSAAEVINHVTSADSPVTYWNGVTRFYLFMAVVVLIGPMRDAFVWQRALAAREAAAAEQLRALSELRDALSHEDLPDHEQLEALSDLRDALKRLDLEGTGAGEMAVVSR